MTPTTLTERPRITFPTVEDRTATQPAEHRGLARDQVRLLVAGSTVEHARFRELPSHLKPGDVVVINTSATRAGEIDATTDERPIVVHVSTALDDGDWVVELRSSPDAATSVLDAQAGSAVHLAGGVDLTLLRPYPHEGSSPTGRGNRLWRARVSRGTDLGRHLERHGRPIQYGYLERPFPLSDYQTVFSQHPGSAEMPSAGRPFTHEVITCLIARGVQVAPITLHTGLSSQEAGEAPQPEWFEVPSSTADLVNSARAGGGRVVAVGTTVTRALESSVDDDGQVRASSGWTSRVVTPANPPQVVNGLITGWHDPMASHLLLIEAVAGVDLAQRAYDAATAGGYLWHEFGDSALLLP